MSFLSNIGHDLHNVFHGIEHGIEGVGKGIESIVTAPGHAVHDLVSNTLQGHPFKGFEAAAHDLAGGVAGGAKGAVGSAFQGAEQTLSGAAGLELDVDTAPEQMSLDAAQKLTSYL